MENGTATLRNRFIILVLAIFLVFDGGSALFDKGRQYTGGVFVACYYPYPYTNTYTPPQETHPERGCGLGEEWQQLITNGDFESGDFSGWGVAALDGAATAGTIQVINSVNAPYSGTTLAGPSRGSHYAASDQSGPSTQVLLQDFKVPSKDDTVWLTFFMFALDLSTAGPVDTGFLDHTAGTNQHVRVDILENSVGPFETGVGVVRNLYLGVDGFTPGLPYYSYSFDLDEDLVPGNTYQLRFAFSATQGPIHMGVDNVSIRSRSER